MSSNEKYVDQRSQEQEPTKNDEHTKQETEAKPKTLTGFQWFIHDMKKGHLVWVKMIFFFQSASLVTLYPYLTIHMRSLGFSLEDTALVNSALPVADIIGLPQEIWGNMVELKTHLL